MSCRDLEERRSHHASLQRRRQVRLFYAWAGAAFVSVYAAVLAVLLFDWSDRRQLDDAGNAVTVSFDKLREPLTRSRVVAVRARDAPSLTVWLKRDPQNDINQFPADQITLGVNPVAEGKPCWRAGWLRSAVPWDGAQTGGPCR